MTSEKQIAKNRVTELVNGWICPESPARYPELTAVKMTLDFGHRWHLDFSREEDGQRWYASDAEKCPTISWPWIDGFEPTNDDWKSIGFIVTIEMRDLAADIRLPSHSAQELRAAFNEVIFDDAALKAGALSDTGNA